MVFREDLEGGTLGKAAIDTKVAEYRAKLVAEAEVEAASAAAAAAAKKAAAEEKLAAEKKSSLSRYAGSYLSAPWELRVMSSNCTRVHIVGQSSLLGSGLKNCSLCSYIWLLPYVKPRWKEGPIILPCALWCC